MSSYAGTTLDEAVDHAVGLADPGTHAGREHAAIGAWLIELRRLRMVAEERSRLLDKQFAERDRLRGLVARLADNLSRYHLVGERERALLREARAAVGRGVR